VTDETLVLERARRLALRYVVASTLILFLAGIFGVLMRFSQADVGRLEPNFFYAIMTAHGLGAFVGWAAFAVMGFAWWVLAEVGFLPRRFGFFAAEATWWLMVVGVVGVVITTVFMGFAASWVFLYPLSFFGSGRWGDWATGLFSLSVLLAGLSIVVWCLGVLHTVVGPALHAVEKGVLNRLGVAMGWGFLWPRRFATNPRPVPYPVIPLTVIAIDMIIATLPLAVLLVLQIVQSIDPSVTTDPLLAKNVLWWFGHPVVYLLLFPAVAIYYHLIPKYAGRPLVAANVIAIAWTIAVIANVIVWAHHVYLDYPEGTIQAQLNVAMQPLTYALVLPSALSLYALGFTIYRSAFVWTPASTALFLGLVGWLLAGLSGIVNATIAFQEGIHNTLWIVGHFHHMAFLNIGIAIFGAVYHWLPRLSGKAWWSTRAAWWHVWLTFVGVLATSVIWLAEGLDGAPRRFAELPAQYDDYNLLALPFVALTFVGQLFFAVNLWNTLRGKAGAAAFDEAGRPLLHGQPGGPRKLVAPTAEALAILVALALAALAFAIGFGLGRETADGGGGGGGPATATETGTGTTAGSLEGDAEAGAEVFASSGCGSCHTLDEANASGAVGPSLENPALTAALIEDRVRNGRNAMPAFAGRLDEGQIADVTAFVLESSRE
jgi:cytochrome c oxidase subunit 1